MKRNSKFYLSEIIIIITIFMTYSCSSVNNYPKDLIIEIGSGGGFTGLWSGYTLNENGKIISWNGKKQGSNSKDYQKIDLEKIQTIWEKIIDSKVLDLKLQEPGNMSKSIKILANGKLNFYLWDYSRKDSITNNFNKLYEFIFNSLEKKN